MNKIDKTKIDATTPRGRLSILSRAKSLVNNDVVLVLFLLAFVSTIAAYCFVANGYNILYGDAVSRLNISRKILDNLTPGLAQLGNVWLPLPQLLLLPFIWNRTFWHTGLAATFVSTAAFMLGGYYLYKTAYLLTKSKKASYFSTAIYGLNINLLYFQTTAMSETLFISSICIAIYYLTDWVRSKNRMKLIPAAAAVSAMTLVRYEGLAILFSSIIFVYFFTLYSLRKTRVAESNTILYSVLACLGFTLWTIYLTAIFGDPLYWKNYYAGTNTAVKHNEDIKTYANNLSFIAASIKYFVAVVWMNGVIPVIYSLFGLPILLYKAIKKKEYYLLPALLLGSIYLFMVLTLQRNTPIGQPTLNIVNLLSSTTSHLPEFNIRYGLIMLPLVALLSSFTLISRSRLISLIVILGFCIQLISYYRPSYSVIYQIPIAITPTHKIFTSTSSYVTWLQKNYDGGLIMISAMKHDPDMFKLGYDYKTYIHEGTGFYWKISKANPQRYARWVIFDENNSEDQVTKYIYKSQRLEYYNLVYRDGSLVIYKIKTKVDKVI